MKHLERLQGALSMEGIDSVQVFFEGHYSIAVECGHIAQNIIVKPHYSMFTVYTFDIYGSVDVIENYSKEGVVNLAVQRAMTPKHKGE